MTWCEITQLTFGIDVTRRFEWSVVDHTDNAQAILIGLLSAMKIGPYGSVVIDKELCLVV